MSLAALISGTVTFDVWLFCSEPFFCNAVSLKRSKLSPVYVRCVHFTSQLELLGGPSYMGKESDFLGIPCELMSRLACDIQVKTLLGLTALDETGALRWQCSALLAPLETLE